MTIKKPAALALTAALALSALAACSSGSSSSQAETTASVTTAATKPAPPPADGKPLGKYYFSQAFNGDKEVYLNVDMDPSTIYFEFREDGTGSYVSPNGTSKITWSGSEATVEGSSKVTFKTENEKLTVEDGTMTLIYIHESAYEKPSDIPDGKYVFSSAHDDGKPIEVGSEVTAESTYLIFKKDGTGIAHSASGSQTFTWSNGHINYPDGSDATYVLRGTTMTLFEINSTMILKKAPDTSV